jgi:hypothetical protein
MGEEQQEDTTVEAHRWYSVAAREWVILPFLPNFTPNTSHSTYLRGATHNGLEVLRHRWLMTTVGCNPLLFYNVLLSDHHGKIIFTTRILTSLPHVYPCEEFSMIALSISLQSISWF